MAKPKNEKYSGGRFQNRDFSKEPAEDFNSTIIKGSNFYQHKKGIRNEIFPPGMTGVIFQNCNLDNVLVPANNSIQGGTNKQFEYQKDKEAWIVDASSNPVEPLNKERFLRVGVSIDPADIPKDELGGPRTVLKT